MISYVIIGTGPAGIAAAQVIRGKAANAIITLVGDEPHGYYSRPGLAYYLTSEIPEKGLFPFQRDEFKRLNLHMLHTRVSTIHPGEHQIENHTGNRLRYDRLLVATGARATRLDAPGANLEGVVFLDNLEDARRILKLTRKTHSAVVVGGGMIGCEVAEHLAEDGKQVTIVEMLERIGTDIGMTTRWVIMQRPS